jgi:hypothetical protein
MGRESTSLRSTRTLARAGTILYALFLLTVPFGHHDLVCHLKNPQHCAACTSSVLSADPTRPAVVGAWNLGEAGCTPTFQPSAESVLLSVRSTGRSPPSDR